MVKVKLADGTLIDATAEHPFWVVGSAGADTARGSWTNAKDLRSGDHLQTERGRSVVVAHVSRTAYDLTAYNLSVADIHTYYVLAGETPVLVHNSKCSTGKLSDPLPQGMSKHFVNAYDDIRGGRGVPQTDPVTGAQKVFQGRATHEKRWAGALEYRVPGSKGDSGRILVKTLPDGRVVMGWTNDHYKTIKPFSSPHFPNSGWQ